jgi:hypothetical protein
VGSRGAAALPEKSEDFILYIESVFGKYSDLDFFHVLLHYSLKYTQYPTMTKRKQIF